MVIRIKAVSELAGFDLEVDNDIFVNLFTLGNLIQAEQDLMAAYILLALLRGLKFLKIPVFRKNMRKYLIYIYSLILDLLLSVF